MDDLPCRASVPAPSQVSCSLGLCARVHLCTHIPTQHMCTHVRIVIHPYTLTPPHTITRICALVCTRPCTFLTHSHARTFTCIAHTLAEFHVHTHLPLRHTYTLPSDTHSHMSTHTHTSRTPSPTHTHTRTIDAPIIHTCSLPLTCTHLYSHTGALTHAHPTQELLPLRSVSPSSASWGTECQTLWGGPFGVAPYPPNCPPPCGC